MALDNPGYAPLNNNENLRHLTKEAADLIIPECNFQLNEIYGSGSTDMGDLSCIMPAIHPYCGGATGKSHGSDYQIVDPIMACVNSAKLQLAMLKLLLKDDAKEAKRIIEEFVPLFASKEDYFAYIEEFNSSGNRIEYGENNTAKINIK